MSLICLSNCPDYLLLKESSWRIEATLRMTKRFEGNDKVLRSSRFADAPARRRLKQEDFVLILGPASKQLQGTARPQTLPALCVYNLSFTSPGGILERATPKTAAEGNKEVDRKKVHQNRTRHDQTTFSPIKQR